MEIGQMHGKISRETSPERVKVHLPSRMRQFRKVHVVYYLCRNGQLEHPHFMELCLHQSKQLKLKDVMERLTALRGRAMISLYSWSCKRSYKNGYVWNDLAEDDVIYPSEGSEYILKGSEILEDCEEDFQQLKIAAQKRAPVPAVTYNEEEERCKVLHQYNHNNASKPKSGSNHCSRGVSTEETEHFAKQQQQQQQQTEPPLDDAEAESPPSSASSEKTTVATQEQSNESAAMDDSEPHSRGLSVLHHLIACGNPAAVKRRASLLMKSPLSSGGGVVGGSSRKSSVGLQRGVLCRVAAARAAAEEEDMNEIKCMSENPRFGCGQLEEKEYFSGSIVDAMSTDMRGCTPEPSLKKSSSYNEEKSSKCRLVGDDDRVIKVEEKSVRGGCIPTKKRANSKQQKA